MDTKLTIANIQPYDLSSVTVVIPPNTPDYTQYFRNGISLDTKSFNYIGNATVQIDTAGLYNVFTRQTVKISQKTGDIVFEPGRYDIPDIDKKFEISATSSYIKIPRTGPAAYRAIFTNIDKTKTTVFDFSSAPELLPILGLYPEYSIYTIGKVGTNTTESSKPPNYYWQEDTYISPFITDISAGLDTVYIGADLITSSSLIGQNYILIAPIDVKPGEIYTASVQLNLPISKTNFSSITWNLR
jgi:hypothetical protein